MRRIKDMITIPFLSCRKSTTATAAAPLVAASDDDDVGATSSPTPHLVLRMHLHCASCAVKIERLVMDIPGVETVATDVEASRVTVTGTADAAAVATSVQVRTGKPVTVVRDGRGAREQSSTAAREVHEDQPRVRGTSAAAQVRPVPARGEPDEEIAGRPAQEKAAEWTAEVRIAGRQCGRCMGRIVQRVSRFHGVKEIIKLTLPDRANGDVLSCRRQRRARQPERMNQQLNTF